MPLVPYSQLYVAAVDWCATLGLMYPFALLATPAGAFNSAIGALSPTKSRSKKHLLPVMALDRNVPLTGVDELDNMLSAGLALQGGMPHEDSEDEEQEQQVCKGC